jgi:aspartate/tyrosine/aromatic aminotransferase
MESLILLGIENLELDWGKQHIWRNHSKLFCESDIKPASYYYFDDQNDSYRIENKPAYVRKLGGLIRRLELLGYTLSECCEQYTEQTHSAADYCTFIL